MCGLFCRLASVWFCHFGYRFALVSVVTWVWTSVSVRTTCLQIPPTAVSQCSDTAMPFLPAFPSKFMSRVLKNNSLSPDPGMILLPSEQFSFLFFFYCHCLITILDHDIRCNVCSPTKKFILHLSFQLDYFKAQDSQVEIVVVF